MSRASFRVDADGLGVLLLERADARNAIDPGMVVGLAQAVDAAAGDPAVRAVLIRALGPTFSVGGDLAYLGERADRLAEELEPMIGRYHETLARLAELPVPVVCAAKGAVAGGALGLLWCADVTIVDRDAKLAAGFLSLGLSGDGGSSWWLPRMVGVVRAKELLLGGRVLSGSEAAEWGLVTAALPAEEVDAHAERVASDLAACPTTAYAEIRALLAAAPERDLRRGLEAEQAAMLRTAATSEARERVGRGLVPRTGPGDY
jgi:2-(1,2-epoxy-1,2-dihydrophenyl)acetyl-CoA isomerase